MAVDIEKILAKINEDADRRDRDRIGGPIPYFTCGTSELENTSALQAEAAGFDPLVPYRPGSAARRGVT